MNPFGVNLSFAVKRWPEPEAWARLVREELGLSLVQFSFDLLDPWWPDDLALPLARRVRGAVAANGLTLHSAFVGLAAYTYNGLLHPDAEGRRAARRWWERAVDLAAEMGAKAVGGPVGGMSVVQAAQGDEAARRYEELLGTLTRLTERAAARGLEAWLLEPTPLPREVPWTVAGARKLLADLEGRAALPVKVALDVGHALYRPLYGEDAGLEGWLDASVGLLHLQQTDGQSDSHWGFTREGIVNVKGVLEAARGAGLTDIPIFLEVFYPFEQDDAEVLSDVRESVQYCKEVLQATRPPLT